MSRTENPLESISIAMATWSGDWSTDPRLAWIYGIVNGWDDNDGDAMAEMSKLHGWTPEAVARLRRLHAEYQRLATGEPPQSAQ